MHHRRTIPLCLAGLLAVAPAAFAQGGARDVAMGRGGRVEIRNSEGSVTVTGTDSDRLAVNAVYDNGRPASVAIEPDGQNAFTVSPSHDEGDDGDDGGGTVRLEVRVPRDANLSAVDVADGDVVVTGVHGDVHVTCGSGNVRVSDVGSLDVRASSGNVTVDGSSAGAYVEASSGNVEVRGVKGGLVFRADSGNATVENSGGAVEGSLASGNFRLKNAAGVVRVDAISGDVDVASSGPLTVRSASGNVSVVDTKGDVDVNSASGDVSFTGEISGSSSYKLRSLSGNATMRVCGTAPGFTATLRSYSGEIETDFPLKIDNPSPVSRGLTGRYGDGKADILIEVQSGSAQILSCDKKN